MKKITMILMIAISVSCAVFGQTKKVNAGQNPGKTKSVKAAPKVFVILEITVHDAAMYEEYRIQVEPLIKKNGGKYLARSGGVAFDNDPDTKLTPVEGDWNPDRLIILQWDSVEQLQRFSKSPELIKVTEIRKKSATTRSVMVMECLKN